MKKFEYKIVRVISVYGDEPETTLNRLGEDGWELVALGQERSDCLWAWPKREKTFIL